MGWLSGVVGVLLWVSVASASPILDLELAAWVCPVTEPFCFGVPVTLAPPVTIAPPITVEAPVTFWAAIDPPEPLGFSAAAWADPPLTANAEPGSLFLLGTTLTAVGWWVRQRRRKPGR